MSPIHDQLTAFYDALENPATKDVDALLTGALAPEWRTHASEADPGKSREEFIAFVKSLPMMFSDLRWTTHEMVEADGVVVVRGTITATPAGDTFMGVPTNGRAASIMFLHIHHHAAGELVSNHYVEDWAAAMGQVTG